MQMLYPLMIDGGQLVGDALALLEDGDRPRQSPVVLVRSSERLSVRWHVADREQIMEACRLAAPGDSVVTAMLQASAGSGSAPEWPEATRIEIGDGGQITRATPGWAVLFSRSRFVGLLRPTQTVPPPAAPHPAAVSVRQPAPPTAPAMRGLTRGGAAAAPRGLTRGKQRAPQNAADASMPADAAPA